MYALPNGDISACAIPVTQSNGRIGFVTTPASGVCMPPFTPAMTPAPLPVQMVPSVSVPVFPNKIPAGAALPNGTIANPDGSFAIPHPAPRPHAPFANISHNPENVAPSWPWYPTPAQPVPPAAVPADVLGWPWLQVPTVMPASTVLSHMPSSTVQLSTLLAYNPVNPMIPHLKWDLADPPDRRTVKKVTGTNTIRDLTKKEFAYDAVYPPGMPMLVRLVHRAGPLVERLWGGIVVDPPKKGNITTMHVLTAIHDFFQVQIHEGDKEQIYHDHNDPNYINLYDAWRRRCKHSLTSVPDAEMKLGFKRIDMLGDDRRWMGKLSNIISASTRAAHVGTPRITNQSRS